MEEKLIIRNFGPLKNIELNLKRFNVLIGENATGKSTIAKMLSVCKYFSYIIPDENPSIMGETNFQKGLIAWGLEKFTIEGLSYISYECPHYQFIAEHKRSIEPNSVYDQNTGEPEYNEIVGHLYITKLIPKSLEFKNLLEILERIMPNAKSQYGYVNFDNLDRIIPSSFFSNEVSRVMDNPFYLPTERGLQSIFSLGKSSINNLTDSLFNQFAGIDGMLRNFVSDTVIEPLGISYKNINGKGFINSLESENKIYDLDRSASGYQSTIPVVLIIKYYTEIRKKSKSFIIEEPELNLFPKAQNKLMEFLVDKIMNYQNSILIITHSPYILTALNNLIFADKVGRNFSEKVEKIISKNYWLNNNEISSYMILSTGESICILDKENLIRTEKIDSVSSHLNKEFNEIFDIELTSK